MIKVLVLSKIIVLTLSKIKAILKLRKIYCLK